MGALKARAFAMDDRTLLAAFGCICRGVAHMHAQSPPIAHRCVLFCTHTLTPVPRSRCAGSQGGGKGPAAVAAGANHHRRDRQPKRRSTPQNLLLPPPRERSDLKVENVLQLGEGRWVICDFGSATSRAQVYTTPEEIAAAEESIRRTTTPAYRAPEMWDLQLRQRIDAKADIWVRGRRAAAATPAFCWLLFRGEGAHVQRRPPAAAHNANA
jgi:serine/threonine protein kinase